MECPILIYLGVGHLSQHVKAVSGDLWTLLIHGCWMFDILRRNLSQSHQLLDVCFEVHKRSWLKPPHFGSKASWFGFGVVRFVVFPGHRRHAGEKLVETSQELQRQGATFPTLRRCFILFSQGSRGFGWSSNGVVVPRYGCNMEL